MKSQLEKLTSMDNAVICYNELHNKTTVFIRMPLRWCMLCRKNERKKYIDWHMKNCVNIDACHYCYDELLAVHKENRQEEFFYD